MHCEADQIKTCGLVRSNIERRNVTSRVAAAMGLASGGLLGVVEIPTLDLRGAAHRSPIRGDDNTITATLVPGEAEPPKAMT